MNTIKQDISENKAEDLKLTPEIKKKLQELKGFTPDDFFYWTPPLYKKYMPREEWPIFKLKGRDGISLAHSDDETGYYKTKSDQMYMTTGKARISTIRNHVLDWKNYKDKNNNNIEIEKDLKGLTNRCLKRISRDMQLELEEAINTHSHLTPEEIQGLEF